MKIKPAIILLLILQTVFLVSCSEKKILPEDKFVTVYAELIFAQDTSSTLSSKQNFKSIILSRYNVSEKMYDSTVAYYNADPQRWTGFFDKVTKHVQDLQKQKKQ